MNNLFYFTQNSSTSWKVKIVKQFLKHSLQWEWWTLKAGITDDGVPTWLKCSNLKSQDWMPIKFSKRIIHVQDCKVVDAHTILYMKLLTSRHQHDWTIILNLKDHDNNKEVLQMSGFILIHIFMYLSTNMNVCPFKYQVHVL